MQRERENGVVVRWDEQRGYSLYRSHFDAKNYAAQLERERQADAEMNQKQDRDWAAEAIQILSEESQ